MPQALPYLAAYGATAAGASQALSAFVALVVTVGVSQYQRSSAQSRARQQAQDAIRSRNITLRSAIAPRTIALGTVRTSGPLMYGEFVGTNQEYLDEIVAVNHGELSEVVGVYVGDEYIAAGNISSYVPTAGKFAATTGILQQYEETFAMTGGSTVTLGAVPAAGAPMYAVTSTGSGEATVQLNIAIISVVGAVVTLGDAVTGTLYVGYQSYDALRPPLRVQWATGSASQASTSWPGVSTPKWTSDHRLRGVAYVRTLKLIDHPLYLAGTSTDVSLVVRGPKGVWDPRTSTTLDYTSNPALLAAWYRTLPRAEGGMGVPGAWIDWTSVATAANICDELISVRKLDGSGYEDVKRYECHTRLSLDRPRAENLQVILGAMAGDFPFTGGKYKCFAGAFRTATVTITDDDVAANAPISFAPAAGGTEVPPNVVTSQFYDAARGWVLQPAKAVENDTYIAADGQEEPVEVELPATTDERQANYLMGVALERARPSLAGSLTIKGKGSNLALLDTVQFSLQGYGVLAGKTFEVRRRGNQWNGQYPVEVREVKTSTYALDADRFVPPPAVTPPSNSILFDVDAPTGVSAAEEYITLPDGTRVNRVRVVWDAHPQAYVRERGFIRLRWRQAGGDWIYEPQLPGSAVTAVTAAAPIGVVMIAQVQAINGAGGESSWTQANVVGITAGTVFVEERAAGVSVTGLTGSPFGSTTLLVEVSFVARYTGKARVQFAGSADHTTASSGTAGIDDYAVCRTSLWVNSTRVTTATVRQIDSKVGFGEVSRFPVVYSDAIPVVAGNTYVVEVRGQKLSSAATLTVTDINLQVQMV